MLAELVNRQNADGGWGYRGGKSWSEPTCLAVLALGAQTEWPANVAAGRLWLRSQQRIDGGWSPNPCVNESTWVTSAAVLALEGSDADRRIREAGLRWIIRETSADSGVVERLRLRLLGSPATNEAAYAWPWFPRTASWVTPTSLSMIALRQCDLPGAQDRVKSGSEFLIQRRCPDGGWNHGGSAVRSENANSYPETTGLALLALQNQSGAEISRALVRAHAWLPTPGSAEGLGWLRLGLRAHAQNLAVVTARVRCWTVNDLALTALSEAEGQKFP